MSKGMLGLLPLSEVRGPVNDLYEKLAGPNGPQWLRRFKRFLRRQFILTLGDGRTKEQLLAAGHYDVVGVGASAFISSNQFRIAQESEEVDIELVELAGLGRDPKEKEVLKELKRRGLKEPTEEDALRFGEIYPHVQREFSIVFLHAKNFWRGTGISPSVLILDTVEKGRRLTWRAIGESERWYGAERYCLAGRSPRKT
ncbi:MAG: hypothetical protein Q8P58_02375 [Candidatus Adlerbacteria bacterium]|nr:hypothetical protein [Candidatus Adlerbacteria bacterium]